MNALLFTLATFSYWGLVGFAVIAISKPRLRVLQGVLLSPAVGIATTILPVFFINRMGVPVGVFGGVLLPALALMSVCILFIRRPVFPIRRLFPFIGILVGALVLAARPMVNYGFDWLSFGNDDMANYCLGAQRFLNHGFFDRPNAADLLSGKDYSLAYWFMHAVGGVRSGSELMLATVWAFSGFNAHQIFMPIIMALHLALISGTGAMAIGADKARGVPLIAMGLLALSPLTSLGALYQLIGQVGGLALLVAAVTLMYRPAHTKKVSRIINSCVPATLIFAGIFIWYPEVLPFFGLGWIVYTLLAIIFKRQSASKMLTPAIIVGALVLIGLNQYVVEALRFMLGQVSGGMHSADAGAVLFPYFLVPSGIAAFWGIIPIAAYVPEPLASLSIALGLALFYWLGRYVLPRQVKYVSSSISMLLVMLAMGILLFFRNNDFGAFKLAMFAQPFLVGVLAIELGRMQRSYVPHYSKIALPLFLAPQVISQYGYVGKSVGEEFGNLNEIPYASVKKINKQFDDLLTEILSQAVPPSVVVLDTSNVVLAKFQTLYTNNKIRSLFPARSHFDTIFSFGRKNEAGGLVKQVSQYAPASVRGNDFGVLKENINNSKNAIYVHASVKSEIFNSYHLDSSGGRYFSYSVHPVNRLQFIHSKLGNHYYLGDRKATAFYQLENDPMFPGQKFASLGRHLLFEGVNPSDRPRVVMELTSTIAKQFQSELPVPSVENSKIKFVGRGSGRIVSERITPSRINESSYFSIDMGRDGMQFPGNPRGLMQLYGREIPADQRRITVLGRDISLVSEEQYQAIRPPASLQNFPVDLANKNIEYSGIYEDGWISEKAFFVLSPNEISRFVTVAGFIPEIGDSGFSTIMTLSINGQKVDSRSLGVGDFEVKLPVTFLAPRQRIDVEFSNHQKLPSPDGRIAPAKINFVGFQ